MSSVSLSRVCYSVSVENNCNMCACNRFFMSEFSCVCVLKFAFTMCICLLACVLLVCIFVKCFLCMKVCAYVCVFAVYNYVCVFYDRL